MSLNKNIVWIATVVLCLSFMINVSLPTEAEETATLTVTYSGCWSGAYGSEGSTTPLRYDINFSNYYYVTAGEIDVKLIPPRSSKYLYAKNDYDNFEFRSPVDPWNVEEKYRADYDKIKSLDVTIKKGTILHIPPYWWYSIKYKSASVCTFKYRTFMNSLAIMPQCVLGLLQSQNIKRDIVNKLDLKKDIEEEVQGEIQQQTTTVNNDDVTEIEQSLKETVSENFATQ